MAKMKTEPTPEGYVVRRIFPRGEDAYRWRADGGIDRCINRQGPWVLTNAAIVPAAVMLEFAKEARRQQAA